MNMDVVRFTIVLLLLATVCFAANKIIDNNILWPNEIWKTKPTKILFIPLNEFHIEVDGRNYELGFRDDGIMVWRLKK